MELEKMLPWNANAPPRREATAPLYANSVYAISKATSAGTDGAKGELLMKHRTKTRALSWLLTLALVLGLMPGMGLTAQADETESSTVKVSTYDELKNAIQNSNVQKIIVLKNIDIPCESAPDPNGTDISATDGDLQTCQLIISHTLTIEGNTGNEVIKRTAASGAVNGNLKSMIAIKGNGDSSYTNAVRVTLQNIVIDGGAVWADGGVLSGTNTGVSGRSMIDVYKYGVLNLEDHLEIRNGHTKNSRDTMLKSSIPSSYYGGGVRVDWVKGAGAGGTINVKAGATIHDCYVDGYGGALGSYNYSHLNVYGGTIRNCRAKFGGAIGCTFKNETLGEDAGFINMYGGLLENCKADNSGGGLYLDGKTQDYILGGTIKGCAAANGGAIAMKAAGYNGSQETTDSDNPTVHVPKTSDILVISNCSSSGDTDTNSTGGYSNVYKHTGKVVQADTATVTFDSQRPGDASYESLKLTFLQNGKLGEAFPGNPIRSGYTFARWNTASDGTGSTVTKETIFSSDTTVYAIWTPVPPTAPTISTHPQNLTLTYGYTEGSVSVAATAATDTTYNLTYQWYSNTTGSNSGGTAISGATSASYSVPTRKSAGTTEYYYCVVTAKRDDNNQTKTATSDVATVTVTRAEISPTVEITGWTYGENANDPSLGNGSNPGNGTPEYTYAQKGTESFSGDVPTQAGDYTVKVTIPQTDNYLSGTATKDFTISKKPVTIDGITAKDKTYDGTATATLDTTYAQIVGVVGQDDLTVSAAEGTFENANYGESKTVTITPVLSGDKAGNYTVSPLPTATANITQLPVTITALNQTAQRGDDHADGNEDIKITSGGTAPTTDGTAITAAVTAATLADGDKLTSVTLTGNTSTVADNLPLAASGAVIKKGDTDVTGNYNITYAGAKLTVIRTRPAIKSGESVTASAITYGQSLENSTITGVTMVDKNHTETIVPGTFAWKDSTIMPAVSDSNSTKYIVVFTPNGENAADYSPAEIEVTLTVNPRVAALAWENTDLKYNGSEQKPIATVTNLVEGDTTDTVAVTVSGEQTHSNAKTNTTNYTATASALTGDRAGNYTLTGAGNTTQTFTIAKRSVTLTSATASKVYDGTALTNHTVTEGGDGWADGEGATYTVTGTATLPTGDTPVSNTFSYSLYNNTEADNYNIEVVPGTLTITGRTDADGDDKKYEINVYANSDTTSITYDGHAHTVSGFTENLTYTFNGVAYTVSGLTASRTETDAGEYAVEIEGTPVVKDGSNNVLTEQFIVNKHPGTLTIAKRPVTLTSGSDTKTYDGNLLTKDAVTVTAGSFVTGEGATYTVTGKQRAVGSSSNSFTYAANENTKLDNYEITKSEGTLTVTSRDAKYQISPQAKSGSATYNGTAQGVSGLVTNTFTVEGNTYTVSGLTASGSGTDAGTYTVSVSGTAIVRDIDGSDVSSEFAVTPQAGTMTVNRRRVTLTSATESKEYDGTALTNDTVTVTGDGWASGEGAAYTVTGTRTLAGTTDNSFTYTLNTGTNANNYSITTSFGALTVKNRDTKFAVTLKANSGEYKYDGTEKTVTGWTINGVAGGSFTAENGLAYTVEGMTAAVSATDAGSYAVNVTGTPTVKDAAGNDVTAQFAVSTESGTLTVNRRSVTLTSATRSGVYNGAALTDDTVTVTGDGWADGEGMAFTVTGSQTLPGESANAFTYAPDTGTKPDNYEITKVEGRLTVTSRGTDAAPKYEITVKANSETVTYDGTEHTVSGFETLNFTVDGETYTVSGLTATATGTEAGTYPAAVTGTAVVKNAGGDDLTSQFTVNTADGALTINKLLPVANGAISAAAITYGQALSDSAISGSMKDEATGTAVPGAFAWKLPDTRPAVSDSGTTEFEVVFTPADTENYAAVSGVPA